MSVGAVNKQTGDRIPTAGMTVVDSVLSGSSTNPVQNRVVKAALDEKADTDIVASDFDATASYTAGDYCIYEGKFYKFKNNHSGAWSAADVDEIKIAGELSALKSGLTSVTGKIPIRGSFSLLCNVGTNVFARDTMTLVGGSIPQSPFNSCIMMIVNHASNNATNDTIQVDGANTIIINSQIEQAISVMWLDATNIPIAGN